MRKTALLLTATLLLAACGDSPGGDDAVAADPQGSLEEALERAADWDGVSASLSASGDWQALAAAEGEELPDGVADSLDDGSITIAGTFDGPVAFSLDLETDGATLLGVRFVEGDNPRVTVDLPAVRDTLDEETERNLDDLLGMAGMFGLGELVDAFEDGEWVEFVVPEDAWDDMTPPEDTEQEDDGEDPFRDVLEVLRSDGVEIDYTGADEHGDRLEVTVDPAEVERALAEIDPMLGTTRDEDLPESFALDVWIVDGEIARLAADLSDLDPELDAGGPLVVVIDLEEFTGSVDLPSAATTLDLEEMFGDVFGGMQMDTMSDEVAVESIPSEEMPEDGLPEGFDEEELERELMEELGEEFGEDFEAELEAELEAEAGS